MTWMADIVRRHRIAAFAIESYRTMGLAIVPMMGLGLISSSIVLTWLYLEAGGGIWIVALWQVALNFGSATTAGRGLPGAFIWVGVLVWAIVIVVGWLTAAGPSTRPFRERLRVGAAIMLRHSPFRRLIVAGCSGQPSGSAAGGPGPSR